MTSMEEKNKILELASKELDADPDNLPKMLEKLQSGISDFDEKIRKIRKL